MLRRRKANPCALLTVRKSRVARRWTASQISTSSARSCSLPATMPAERPASAGGGIQGCDFACAAPLRISATLWELPCPDDGHKAYHSACSPQLLPAVWTLLPCAAGIAACCRRRSTMLREVPKPADGLVRLRKCGKVAPHLYHASLRAPTVAGDGNLGVSCGVACLAGAPADQRRERRWRRASRSTIARKTASRICRSHPLLALAAVPASCIAPALRGRPHGVSGRRQHRPLASCLPHCNVVNLLICTRAEAHPRVHHTHPVIP